MTDHRDRGITVRFTPAEKTRLTLEAEKKGLTIAVYVRMLALEGVRKEAS